MPIRTLALCATLATALGQMPIPPAPGGPRGPAPAGSMADGQALRAYLNLSDAQLRELRRAGEQARRQADEKARAMEPQIREKRAALEGLMAKGGDPTAVGKLMLEIRGLEQQAHDARRAARDSFVSRLSAEQKARFQAVEDAALLPAATREAVHLGLVPGAEPRMQAPHMQRQRGPNPMPMARPGQPRQPPVPPQPPQQPQPPARPLRQ